MTGADASQSWERVSGTFSPTSRHAGEQRRRQLQAKLIHYSVENKLYGLPETTVRRHNRQALRTGGR